MKNEQKISWFALKVFFNRTTPIKNYLDEKKIQYFIPSDVIASLIFCKSTYDQILELSQDFFGKVWVYGDSLEHKPLSIPDEEMEIFIFVATAGKKGLVYLGDDKPEYHVGDRVRVTEGPFKGAEGHIKRIKKDRRLIVAIRGVAAVATTFIHPSFLEIV